MIAVIFTPFVDIFHIIVFLVIGFKFVDIEEDLHILKKYVNNVIDFFLYPIIDTLESIF